MNGLPRQPGASKRPWLMLLLLGLSVASIAYSLGSCSKNNPTRPPNHAPTKPEIDASAPADSATGLPTSVVLTWTSTDPDGDSIVYDVYFGAANPPPKVSNHQPENTYSPSGIAFATRYFWRVVAIDQHQSESSSDTWTFATRIAELSCHASADTLSGVVPLTVSFHGDATGGVTPYTYSWSFGDGNSSAEQNPQHVYAIPGDYTAELVVTDSQQRISSQQVTPIQVDCPPLTCAGSGDPMTGAPPLPVAFTATASGGCQPYTWSWVFGDGSTSTEKNPSHTYLAVGDYTATVTVTDSRQHTASQQVGPIHLPCPALTCAASANQTSGEAPLLVDFTASARGGCGSYTWLWVFGDGGSSTQQNPSYAYHTAGDYAATMTVTDSQQHTCSEEVTPIHVTCPSLTCSASASTMSGDVPIQVSFTATAGGGCQPYAWSWTFGDGGTSAEQNPRHTYQESGTYTVTMTVTDSQQHTCSQQITPIQLTCPTLNCTVSGYSLSGPAPLHSSFAGSASGGCPLYSWSWVFGDGGTSTEQNPDYTYQTPGDYTATMTVTDSQQHSCSRSLTPINVTCPILTCSASGNPTSGAAPLQVTFTATATGGCAPYIWSWAFGDGSTGTDQNPVHTYSTAGDYTATMTVTDSQQHTCSKQVTPIHVACPSLTCAASGNPTSGAAPLQVTFTATATGGCAPYTWGWDFGDGGTGTDQNPIHTYGTAGDYTATMTVTDSQQHTCSQQVTPIHVACPSFSCAASGNPTSGAAPLQVTFTATATGGCPPYTWSWDFGDGGTGTDQNPIHTYGTAGDYTATMTVTDSQQHTCSKQVTPIHVACPALTCAASGNPTSGAAPLQVTFTATATGGCAPYTWSWDFGDGTTGVDQNPIHTYGTAGDYTATMTVTDSQQHTCSKQVTPIHVACPSLTCAASGNPMSGAPPLQVTFTGSGTGGCPPYTWSWDFGDGTTGTDQSPIHTYSAAGDYTATMTVTDSQQHTCSKQVTPIHVACPIMTCAASGNPMSGAPPLQVTFTGSGTGGCPPYTWSWDFGDGGTGTDQSPIHTYSAAGDYTATMTVTDSQQHTCNKQVTPIHVACPTMTCSASADSMNGAAPLQVTFAATATGGCAPYTWSWDFGDGGSGTDQNPVHTYDTPGDYTATMTVTDSQQHTCSQQVTPIHVACPNMRCTASADPMNGVAPLEVTFTATVDGGCGPYTWSWDFGDGGSGTDQNPVHTYDTPGDYTATMTVTDSQEHTCSQQLAPIQVTSSR